MVFVYICLIFLLTFYKKKNVGQIRKVYRTIKVKKFFKCNKVLILLEGEGEASVSTVRGFLRTLKLTNSLKDDRELIIFTCHESKMFNILYFCFFSKGIYFQLRYFSFKKENSRFPFSIRIYGTRNIKR